MSQGEPRDPTGRDASAKPAFEVHASAFPAWDAEGGLRVPGDGEGRLPGWRLTRLAVPSVAGAEQEERLARLVAALDAEARAGRAPLVLLSGPLHAQLALVRRLIPHRQAFGAGRFVHCIPVAARPFLPTAPARWIHGLLLDSPPLAVERACWTAHIDSDPGARVVVMSSEARLDMPPRDARERSRLGIDATAFVVGQIVQRAGPWAALGMQAFQIWAGGHHRSCGACGAVGLDRFATESARHEQRERCVVCASPDLTPGAPVPDARLVTALATEDRESPDPGVLADWLGCGDRAHVLSPSGGGRPCGEVMALCDVALLLGDPAFRDPLLSRAAATGRPCIVNGARDGSARHVIAVSSRQCSWDHRNHMTAYPSLRELVRALQSAHASVGPCAAVTDVPREPQPAASTIAAWKAALDGLHAAPRVSLGRRPRHSRRRTEHARAE